MNTSRYNALILGWAIVYGTINYFAVVIVHYGSATNDMTVAMGFATIGPLVFLSVSFGYALLSGARLSCLVTAILLLVALLFAAANCRVAFAIAEVA